MALLNIVKEGDPVLRGVCREVTEITPRIITLLDDMRETLAKAEGVGLAAPQVTYLMHEMKEKGMDVPTDATTIEEAADGIMKALKKERTAK